MADIDSILKAMMSHGASDLHLTAGFKPFIRESGDIVTLDECELCDPARNEQLLREIMPERNQEEADNNWDTDFAYAIEGLARFRVNVFRDRFGMGAVLRTIPTKPLTADELNLPKAIRDFCYLPKGLVVVTGPTGSGKSTTLAAMIDLINKTRSDHIITIEDPIEFIHTPQSCLVNQRELHVHTKSFSNAVRAALREDPDIVLVGEMRDLETMEIAIEAAETGHLVFGTLHTNTAATTVERIIDKFPTGRQNQIRSMLSSSLKGVVAQNLCKKKGGKGRVAAMEILIVTSGIASNIRDGKTHFIESSMQTGKGIGMQLLDDALIGLVTKDVITPQEGYMKASDKNQFAKILADNGIEFDLSSEARPVPSAKAAVNTTLRRKETKELDEATKERQRVLNGCLAAIKKDPENPEILNNIAWILATSTNPDLRNSHEALAVAERACAITKGQNPGILDTLGAAYAGTGQFDKAMASAKRGIALAQAAEEHELVKALQQRIALYELGQSVRE